jgi:hypothetical protein
MILVLLQNAYGVEDGYIPSYTKESFINCHTGRRLREALPEGVEVEIRNASPLVGKNADSYFKFDTKYIRNQIENIKPTVILACGKSATDALQELALNVPVVFMPHPAYRALSKDTTAFVKRRLEYFCGLGEVHG